MKEKLFNSFFVCIRILASAWLTFLVSMIPLYIWRGTHSGDESGENLLMSVIGLIFGFVFMMLLQAKDDKSCRYSLRDATFAGGGGVLMYIALWVLLYLPTKNNYLVAALGYNLSCLIGSGADRRPTFSASLLSALIFGLIYLAAFSVGIKIAHIKKKRFLNDIKK